MGQSAAINTVADYLASMSPQMMLDFHAPPEMQKRLEKLINKEKKAPLKDEEKEELDNYIVLERIIRLAKANAFIRLNAK